jgi:hypothetical protein
MDFWQLYQIAVKDDRELAFLADWQRSGRRFPTGFAANLTCRSCGCVFRDQFRLLVPICLACVGHVPDETLDELKARIRRYEADTLVPTRVLVSRAR